MRILPSVALCVDEIRTHYYCFGIHKIWGQCVCVWYPFAGHSVQFSVCNRTCTIAHAYPTMFEFLTSTIAHAHAKIGREDIILHEQLLNGLKRLWGTHYSFLVKSSLQVLEKTFGKKFKNLQTLNIKWIFGWRLLFLKHFILGFMCKVGVTKNAGWHYGVYPVDPPSPVLWSVADCCTIHRIMATPSSSNCNPACNQYCNTIIIQT